ncbi:MAG: hypothetical protein ACKOAH_33815, partial [Pirellula sp.]
LAKDTVAVVVLGVFAVQGEEIVDQIAKVKTGRVKGSGDVPIEPITLKRAMILEGAAAAAGSDSDKKDK